MVMVYFLHDGTSAGNKIYLFAKMKIRSRRRGRAEEGTIKENKKKLKFFT